jgi:hypothetical protein
MLRTTQGVARTGPRRTLLLEWDIVEQPGAGGVLNSWESLSIRNRYNNYGAVETRLVRGDERGVCPLPGPVPRYITGGWCGELIGSSTV